MARYGDARLAERSLDVHRGYREASGSEDRLPGGHRLPSGLDHGGEAARGAAPMLKNQYGQYLLKVIGEVERTGEANL